MPIYVDVSAAVHHRAGLGRYAESLVRELADQIPERLALFYNQEHGIAPLSGLAHLPSRTVALGYKPWRMLVWMAQIARIPVNRLAPDATLFHATEHLLLPLREVPTILTVHDLIFLRLPEHHKRLNRWYLRWTMPLFCRRADHIIAVSEATRQDILRAYGVPKEKITVIHEAADPRFRPHPADEIERVRSAYGLPPRFLLYVGTIEPRKNLAQLLEAWTPLYLAGECPPLVIVGKAGWLSEPFFAALASSEARDGVLLAGYVPDADLPAIYTAAEAFVWPSLYEGFGLPPLEAMACGTPVVCSDVSSMPEIVDDAAMMFSPSEPQMLRQCLRRISKDVALREDLRRRGFDRAAQFSWAETAAETAALYERVLRGYPDSA
jgi:glycosyltransferase involved in cell wall biosynthesis